MTTITPITPINPTPQKIPEQKVPRPAYLKVRELLIKQIIANPKDEELKATYGDFTGDHKYTHLMNEIVYSEIKGFIDSIDKVNEYLSLEDYGHDCENYYLRFWCSDLEYLNTCYKEIIEFLQNVSDRTGVEITPDFNFYKKLKPSEDKTIEVKEAPALHVFKKMDLELNEK